MFVPGVGKGCVRLRSVVDRICNLAEELVATDSVGGCDGLNGRRPRMVGAVGTTLKPKRCGCGTQPLRIIMVVWTAAPGGTNCCVFLGATAAATDAVTPPLLVFQHPIVAPLSGLSP